MGVRIDRFKELYAQKCPPSEIMKELNMNPKLYSLFENALLDYRRDQKHPIGRLYGLELLDQTWKELEELIEEYRQVRDINEQLELDKMIEDLATKYAQIDINLKPTNKPKTTRL